MPPSPTVGNHLKAILHAQAAAGEGRLVPLGGFATALGVVPGTVSVLVENVQTPLTCPLQTPVTVGRTSDQDAKFLRFIEENDLEPGQTVEVEGCDPPTDSVRVEGHDCRRITIGARAASKLLAQVAGIVWLVLLGAGVAAGQSAPRAEPVLPFEILDNSFLVEEAFNQEPGVVQNIVTAFRNQGGWEIGFTQEWPVRSQRHQLSYLVPFAGVSGERGIGDVMINYRWQALLESPGRPAFSPRLSIILPSGNADRGLGSGATGWQTNLPVSKQFGDVYLHANGGGTWLRGVATGDASTPAGDVTLFTPHVSGSVIYRIRPMLNAMVETTVESSHEVAGPGMTSRHRSVTFSPGARGGWNLGDHQLILGVAIPVTWAASTRETAVFGYLSYELPFGR